MLRRRTRGPFPAGDEVPFPPVARPPGRRRRRPCRRRSAAPGHLHLADTPRPPGCPCSGSREGRRCRFDFKRPRAKCRCVRRLATRPCGRGSELLRRHSNPRLWARRRCRMRLRPRRSDRLSTSTRGSSTCASLAGSAPRRRSWWLLSRNESRRSAPADRREKSHRHWQSGVRRCPGRPCAARRSSRRPGPRCGCRAWPTGIVSV